MKSYISAGTTAMLFCVFCLLTSQYIVTFQLPIMPFTGVVLTAINSVVTVDYIKQEYVKGILMYISYVCFILIMCVGTESTLGAKYILLALVSTVCLSYIFAYIQHVVILFLKAIKSSKGIILRR